VHKAKSENWRWVEITVMVELVFLINKTYQLQGKERERQIHLNVNANITLDLQ
jgi:hypothetical protein